MTITGKGGRPLGLPKSGGRQKGTPNRATLTLNEKLDALGCDPLIELAKLGMNEKISIEIRMRCLSEIASYVYPKRKPVDASDHERPVINVSTNLENSDDPGNERDQPQSETQVAAGTGI
jgi:hypothetical protein